MRSRKLSARIFMLGWRWMKAPMRPAKTSITPTAMNIATIMMETCFAMPTAVMTESSEKTMSSTTICAMTEGNDAFTLGWSSLESSTSSLSNISWVDLPIRNTPPPSRIRSRPLKSCPSRLNRVALSPITHEIASRRSSRIPRARRRPMRRAIGCWSGGSFAVMMERKTMLSIPRTISSALRVARVIQPSTCRKGLMSGIGVALCSMRRLGRLQPRRRLRRRLRRQPRRHDRSVPRRRSRWISGESCSRVQEMSRPRRGRGE
ncbi:hypothetical protein BE08_37155 [Sorangium cellulosum]|uniref:Uncharacterized protein n=1 Tax=Sorangium cellulosum TaxID=56 RepID=A0A150P667_SORCE|nr:hypothetical protein BE08_37155 [Sorangium cellulosum]